MKTICFVTILFISLSIYSQNQADHMITVIDGNCKIFDPNYREGKTYKWSGDIRNDFASGTGICEVYIADSLIERIEANYIQGVAQGKGKIKVQDHEISGTFTDGFMMGKGSIKDNFGFEYNGDLINGVAHGKGRIIYTNGSEFVGMVNSNNFWTGKYIDLQDNVTYFYRGEKVESLPNESKYDPELNVLLTEYFDDNEQRCNKSEASYFRKITYKAPNVPVGVIRDYYIDGTLMGEFECFYVDYYDTKLNFKKAGNVKYYYQDGNLYFTANYNQRNRLFGESKYFYPNGLVKETAIYNDNGLLDGDRYIYNEEGYLIEAYYYQNGQLENDVYFTIDNKGYWTANWDVDFERNSDLWSLDDLETYAYVFDQRVVIYNKKKGSYMNVTNANLDPLKSHAIYLKVYSEKKPDVSLLFDYLDSDNFSFLSVANNTVSVERYVNGQYFLLYEGKYKGTKGFNSLLLQNYDGVISFYINQQEIYQCRSWEYSSTSVGFYCGTQGFNTIDELSVLNYFSAEESIEFNNYVKAGGTRAEKQREQAGEIEWDANGSAFFISNDGHVATNYHVVEDAKKIVLEFYQNGEKKSYDAEVVLSDKTNDLSILKIKDEKFSLNKPLPYELNFDIQDVGSSVFALGYPMTDILGSDIKYTEGSISSKTGIEGDITSYQISVPIQPGNSGGPLFNEDGNIVGITSSILNRSLFESENVNYAIKLSYLKNLMDILPKKIDPVKANTIKQLNTTDKIKILQEYIPVVRIKL